MSENVNLEGVGNRAISSNFVAIVSMVLTALSAAFVNWNTYNATVDVEKLKLEFEQSNSKINFIRKSNEKRCVNITSTASQLAKAHSGFLKEHKFDSQSEIDSYIWEGITQISGENQDRLLSYFAEGPKNDDKYGINHTSKLVGLTLMYLASEARTCIGLTKPNK